MPRKKLDLLNHRFFYQDTVSTVYNSCEDTPIPDTAHTARSHHYDFESQFGRDKIKPPQIYHSNELQDPPRVNRKGNVKAVLAEVENDALYRKPSDDKSGNFK